MLIGERTTTARTAVCLWAVAFAVWLAWYYHFSASCIPIFLAHFAVGVPILVLADEQWRAAVQRRLPAGWRGGALIWVGLVALTVAIAAPEQRRDADFLLRWATYLALPIVGVALASPRVRPVLTTALLAIPVGQLPMIRLTAPGRDFLSFGMLVIIDLALILVLVYRPDERVRYSLWLSRRETGTAVGAYLLFAAIALPLGLLLGFIRPGLGESTVGVALGRLFELYFFVAIAEELVFRAFLQNGFETLVGKTQGLCAAAVIFGLAHVGQAPAPNWRYVVLATGAGLVYGRVYQKTRNITASALTHVLVDWTWFVLFAGLNGK